MLTPAGVTCGKNIQGAALELAAWKGQHGAAGLEQTGPSYHMPRWVSKVRTLYVGGQVVKRFRVPAANQELILAAFEEEKWQDHLDDPLPPRRDVDSKRRLHDAIKGLNRHQQAALIQFAGDGTGRGIHWRWKELASSPDSPQIVPSP